MATVPIRYWRTPMGCITPKASDRDWEVDRFIFRFKRGEDGKPTNEIEGYNLDVLALKGCTQTVKLPVTAKKSIEDLEKILADKQTVRVKFINLVMRAYAMNRNNELFTGISATADGFEITSTEKPEVDDLIDFE